MYMRLSLHVSIECHQVGRERDLPLLLQRMISRELLPPLCDAILAVIF